MSLLLDTNVLVYAVDPKEDRKRRIANAVLDRFGSREDAVLSIQNLAEFANVVLGKLSPKVDPERVYDWIESYRSAFRILDLSPVIVLEAIRGVRDHNLSYFDAQIWAAARLNQITYILSENFNSGSTLEGVTFLDPFSDDFQLDAP